MADIVNSINTIYIINILTELNRLTQSRGKTVCEEHKKLLEYCLKNETIDKNNQQYVDYILKFTDNHIKQGKEKITILLYRC